MNVEHHLKNIILGCRWLPKNLFLPLWDSWPPNTPKNRKFRKSRRVKIRQCPTPVVATASLRSSRRRSFALFSVDTRRDTDRPGQGAEAPVSTHPWSHQRSWPLTTLRARQQAWARHARNTKLLLSYPTMARQCLVWPIVRSWPRNRRIDPK